MSDKSNAFPRLSFAESIQNGLRLKCPRCQQGSLFSRLLSMQETCSVCGFKYERAPGYFLGSTYINYGITALTTTFTYIFLHFGLGWPKDYLLPLLGAWCLVFPLLFFRYARSLWLSLDCFFDHTGAVESQPAFSQTETVGEREISRNQGLDTK
ncbi:MAG: DUF983 domain-containing protein [Planctomycetaceae bacterium]|nr:DUF983 domain-containing protein [Planctomycetaceae bacterium]